MPRRHASWTGSTGGCGHSDRTNYESASSPMSRPGRAGCTRPSSSTCLPVASWVDARAAQCAPTSCSMLWNKLCTSASPNATAASSATPAGGLNTSAFATGSDWPRPASAIRRQQGRQLRQRLGRDHQRAVQGQVQLAGACSPTCKAAWLKMPWQWLGGEGGLNLEPYSTATGAVNIAARASKPH